MEKVELLESYLYDRGVDVVHKCYKGLKGYYRAYPDGYTVMAISPELTLADRTSVSYHEAGHHYTMYEPGQPSRNESRADRWAARKLVPVISLIDALAAGCNNLFEVAEYLQVSENFLYKTLDIYKLIYGEYTEFENWVVAFRPRLSAYNYRTSKYYPED